jgi:hypothetical protein
VQHIIADRRVTDGMVLALSWLIGCPDTPWQAERFITEQGRHRWKTGHPGTGQDQDHDQEKT